jgi:hypothetical protein
MSIVGNASSSAIRRKIRALASVLADRATTAHERANASALKMRLEDQLKADPATTPASPATPAASAGPEVVWASVMFRLGRTVREVRAPPPTPKGDWTDHAFRAGKMLRRLFRK